MTKRIGRAALTRSHSSDGPASRLLKKGVGRRCERRGVGCQATRRWIGHREDAPATSFLSRAAEGRSTDRERDRQAHAEHVNEEGERPDVRSGRLTTFGEVERPQPRRERDGAAVHDEEPHDPEEEAARHGPLDHRRKPPAQPVEDRRGGERDAEVHRKSEQRGGGPCSKLFGPRSALAIPCSIRTGEPPLAIEMMTAEVMSSTPQIRPPHRIARRALRGWSAVATGKAVKSGMSVSRGAVSSRTRPPARTSFSEARYDHSAFDSEP